MDVKERIIQKRKELGLNQTELAKRAGLKPPAISQYESGVRNPSYEAMLKLSNALGVKVDYLISGIETDKDYLLDPMSEVLVKILSKLTVFKKEEIFNYILLTTGQKKHIEALSSDPKQYSKYIYEQYFEKKLPIDVFKLANKLDLKIIFGDINKEAEAILFKRNNTIILDSELKHNARIKFAVTTLIGHLIIPWHTDEIYYYRKKGKSTLLTDNTEEMEANSFTTNLITPPEELEKDLYVFKSKKASLTELKELAEGKYEVSLTSICNRLVEQYNDRFAVVFSDCNNKITKTFSNSIELKDIGSDIDKRSMASELLKRQSDVEEFKEDMVRATTWIENAHDNEYVYESSVFNPEYKSLLTLITRI
ncbi:helix-turn-helix domain-containing protein [Fictibacillus phosphorivorans]|uniref:helix-turn-helix domain-containing protein n=1 Tax=Fictibacillus phosphorivorans TaxID=1221500 RepID=UPI0020425AF5|nr:helix-turn-helix transcriptional regulator [Fictibacillus phosphorivorans]MCM3719436.1 helix-turn-helix domain-containing protein [Fictibacillus phosphorivorans]MCM3777086.1 helix-turn-helix domain-containing protein [Fictibacillus phosphorivorans]